jgi:hypothetical protein
LEFANWALEFIEDKPEVLKSFIFNGEAIFYLNGHVNRQNTRWWSDTNPHWHEEVNTLNDPRVMAWAGVWGDHIIGPYFFEGSVTGASFTKMMETGKSFVCYTRAANIDQPNRMCDHEMPTRHTTLQ